MQLSKSQKNSFIPILVIWLVFLCLSVNTNAHEFEVTEASVIVYSDTEFGLSINVDLIELFGNQLSIDVPENEGSAEQMIESVRSLPLSDIISAVQSAKENFRLSVNVYVDGSLAELEEFETASAMNLYQLLQRNPEMTTYRAEFTSTGVFESGSELQIQFPESLGVVSLSIASPSQTLLTPNELSNGYLMKLGGVQGFSTKVATAVNYTHHGFRHVLPLGLDHILFVVALCLLSTSLSVLVWQISAFTLAHTLTLGLSSAAVINLPSDIVEPIIALSIAWVAFENLFAKKLHKWRIFIVFLFGLIHGLGFASALMGLGLSSSQWLTSLLFFNIGVELGQLAVVAATIFVIYWWRDKPWYPKFMQTPICVMIGFMGLYWAVERTFL